jgi:hypothetical protein
MRKLISVVVMLYAALGSVALAASGPSVAGYGGKAGGTQAGLGGSSGGDPPTTAGETLPFTGLDLAVLVGVAAALLVAGLVLRRVGRNSA